MIHGNSCFKGWRRQGLECPSLRDFKKISQDYFTGNFPRGLGCPKMLSEPGCNACHHNAVRSKHMWSCEAISKVSPHPTMSVLEHQRLTCTYVGSQSDEIDLTRNIIAGAAGSPVHQDHSQSLLEFSFHIQSSGRVPSSCSRRSLRRSSLARRRSSWWRFRTSWILGTQRSSSYSEFHRVPPVPGYHKMESHFVTVLLHGNMWLLRTLHICKKSPL